MSKYFCLCVFILMSTNAFADNAPWAEAIHLTNTWTEIHSVEGTLDGGFFAAGTWHMVSLKGPLLIRLNSSGDVQWLKTYSAKSQQSNVSTALQAPDAGFVIAGNVAAASSRTRALVMKLDSAGNIEWQKTYGKRFSSEDNVVILQATDGGFFLLGTTIWHKTADIWCMKLDRNGNITWQKQYGNSDTEERLISAITTADGGLILSANRFDLNDTTIWLVKINDHGKTSWQKEYSLDSAAYPTAIAATTDSGYAIGGNFFGSADGWVMKVGATGALQWEAGFRYGDSEAPAQVFAIRQEKDGHLLVMGTAKGSIWNARLDLQGKMFWQKAFGGARTTSFPSAAHDTLNDGTVFTGTRSGVSFIDGFIARTSSKGLACSALQRSLTITKYETSAKTSSNHIASAKNTFDVSKGPVFALYPVKFKITNLCLNK